MRWVLTWRSGTLLTHAVRRRSLPLLFTALVLLAGCTNQTASPAQRSICTLPGYVEQDRLDAAAEQSVQVDLAGIESAPITCAARDTRDAAERYLDAPNGTTELLVAAVDFMDALDRLEVACRDQAAE